MNDIQARLSEILRDQERVKRLLLLEKKRRGVPHDALVFVGMANVAQHWWCTQQAVFKSRANELMFFSSYLEDRIRYAHRLGFVTKLPRTAETLLEIGKEITLADVQKLLREEEQAFKRTEGSGVVRRMWDCEERVDSAGNRIRLIHPNLPPEEKEFEQWRAAQEGVQLIDLEKHSACLERVPKWRGEVYQELRAEQYPKIRWNFLWDKYIAIGVADGIRDDFVYEYKSTGIRFLLRFVKPVAFAQADLYGYFFHRLKKRVQIHIDKENVTETWEQPVDVGNAERTLADFARVDAGGSARAPVAWKCQKCEFRSTCPISQAN